MKLSPYSDCDAKDSNPEVIATYMENALSKIGVLYLHMTEPREAAKGLAPIRKAFKGTLIASGGYNKSDEDNAIDENYADLISFGRVFLANPDLPKRFEVNAPLNKTKEVPPSLNRISTVLIDDEPSGAAADRFKLRHKLGMHVKRLSNNIMAWWRKLVECG
ncbi:12-oxophytodienoate reductase 2 [Datura stramonium]|uniref:12-oxophytodienoate reductase 2 n=1 Tax=Datura stramonium TaxID=4076 RepID=A0ABS8UTX6_DATST|nr:12-oxophytodienoate reductase 2 [Datura stramonium]